MSPVVNFLNQNSNEFILANDLKEIKNLLTIISGKTGKGATNELLNGTDDLYLQYPENSREETIAVGGKVTKNLPVRRKLKYLCISVPENCVLEIQNNNTTWAWFKDKAGTLQFPSGVYFDTLTLKVTNLGTEDTTYSCYMIFS